MLSHPLHHKEWLGVLEILGVRKCTHCVSKYGKSLMQESASILEVVLAAAKRLVAACWQPWVLEGQQDVASFFSPVQLLVLFWPLFKVFTFQQQ